jgi:hypothetical protein
LCAPYPLSLDDERGSKSFSQKKDKKVVVLMHSAAHSKPLLGLLALSSLLVVNRVYIFTPRGDAAVCKGAMGKTCALPYPDVQS